MDGYQVLDVGGKKQGYIWSRKLVPDKNDGKILKICHTIQNKGSTSRQHVRFLHAEADAAGERIVMVDHQGNLFLLDLEKNRFLKICNLGLPSTAVTWNNNRRNEILVALSNYEIRCYNVATCDLINVMKSHTSPVHSISIHGSGCYALTSSFDTTILWDLNTFTKRRTLNGAQQVGIQKVFFLQNSNKIVSCFKDDSIFIWDCESMKCLYQLAGPIGKKPAYKCLTSTNDSRILVAGGRSHFLHMWNLDSRQLIQIIELPEKMKEVKEVNFLTDNFAVNQTQLIAVLGQDGILRFIDPHLCKLKAEIGNAEQRIHGFVLSQHMRYVIAVLDNGDISVHHLGTILQPQGFKPLVQKVETYATEKVNKTKDIHKLKVPKKRDVTPSDDPSINIVNGLNLKRLRSVLRGFGEYPKKYRSFIWRSILQLPENHVAFSALVDKGTHNAFATLHEKYPIKSRKLLRVLQRVLSALAYWSPIFGETDYLPMMVFPIVQLFSNNQLICFEIVATLVLNWCQKWFEYFPNPPLSILSIIEILISHHDPVILQHFVKLNISTQIYAWPLLYTLFSEILTKDQWLIVWDNIFSNHPSFIFYFIVAYLIQTRQTILSCKSKEDIEFFFHHRNAVDIPTVIKETYRYSSSTPSNIDPKKVLDGFAPLPGGQYPVFDSYPKFVVDYLVGERERIREEELDYLRQKQEALDTKKQKEIIRQEELTYYREQQHVMQAEQQRRNLIIAEEKKLTAQRKKLQTLRRDIAMQELDVLDEVRRKFLHHQRQVKSMNLHRLDDELQRKMKQREEEMRTALEEAEIKALEIETKKRALHEGLIKREVDGTHKLKMEEDLLRQRQKECDKRFKDIIVQAENIDGEKMLTYQTELAKVCQDRQNARMMEDLGDRKNLLALENEINTIQIKRKDFENKIREEELYDLMSADILQQRDELKEDELKKDESKIDTNFDRSLIRGSFSDRELDLMSQIRTIRSKIARQNPVSIS